MLWMCCREGVWGCCSPLWGCVWAGSGWEPWVGLDPGIRSHLSWTCSTDSEPSSANVLPDPISPGRPDTAHSLWLSSKESPAPAAPWQRSHRSTHQPELYNYCREARPEVWVQRNLGKDDDKHTTQLVPLKAEPLNPTTNNRAAMCECLLSRSRLSWNPALIKSPLCKLRNSYLPSAHLRLLKMLFKLGKDCD